MANVTKLNPARLATVQNKLTVALAKAAESIGLAAKDWIQGGWERGSDKIGLGLAKPGGVTLPNVQLTGAVLRTTKTVKKTGK